MADSFDEPLQDAELKALGAAHSLLRKMARILEPAAGHGATLAPKLDWPNGEDDVLRNLGAQFRRHGLMNFSTRAKLRAGISVGAYAEDGDTGVGVWVWSKPSATAVRRQILERADTGKLPAAWERSPVAWEGLGAYTKLRDVMESGAATRWLVERLDELNAAGIMALLPTLGLGEAEDQEGPEE